MPGPTGEPGEELTGKARSLAPTAPCLLPRPWMGGWRRGRGLFAEFQKILRKVCRWFGLSGLLGV